jgi:hypothetical protein
MGRQWGRLSTSTDLRMYKEQQYEGGWNESGWNESGRMDNTQTWALFRVVDGEFYKEVERRNGGRLPSDLLKDGKPRPLTKTAEDAAYRKLWLEILNRRTIAYRACNFLQQADHRIDHLLGGLSNSENIAHSQRLPYPACRGRPTVVAPRGPGAHRPAEFLPTRFPVLQNWY